MKSFQILVIQLDRLSQQMATAVASTGNWGKKVFQLAPVLYIWSSIFFRLHSQELNKVSLLALNEFFSMQEFDAVLRIVDSPDAFFNVRGCVPLRTRFIVPESGHLEKNVLLAFRWVLHLNSRKAELLSHLWCFESSLDFSETFMRFCNSGFIQIGSKTFIQDLLEWVKVAITIWMWLKSTYYLCMKRYSPTY